MADSSGAAGELESRVAACMEFEHRDKSGNLKGTGKQIIDKRGRIHFIQRDEKNIVIGEIVISPSGEVLEVKEGPSENKSLIHIISNAIKSRVR
jgi:hypothetical protein